MISRDECTQRIVAAKQDKNLTFEQIAAEVGRHPVWTTSALLGQASMSREEACSAAALLDLDEDIVDALQQCPSKGCADNAVPTDPLLYRFYEINLVYGTTIKALIHEKFGDGIMSAIDFQMNIEKKPDAKGDRVLITFDGKFLPYRKW